MGLGDLWNPNLHPRGFHGRFIKKFKLAGWLDDALKNFNPRQFQSQGQANQFAFNQPKKIGKDLLATRRIKMDFDEAADHLRNGDIDPTTQKFMDAIDPHFEPAPPGGLILSRTFGPEAIGLGPQHLVENDPNGIEGMMGNTLQDKMYSPTHLGQDLSPGPGKITMRIATPAGTPVAYSGTNPNDPGVYLNRDQKLLVTQVSPDGRGGWFMSVVAEPPGATSGSPVAAVEGRKGAGLTPEMREARIGGPSVFRQAAPPPSGDQLGHQLNLPGQATEPGPPQALEKATAAAPKRAARKAAYQQARQAEEQAGGIPQGATPPPRAPQPVTPTPSQGAPSGVGERTEPVHGPIGGTPTEGKSASEIAATPPEPAPAPEAAPVQRPFTDVFKESGLKSPSAGPQRREFNNALMGLKSGKTSPEDALRELDADVEANRAKLKAMSPDDPKAPDLRQNIQHQANLADLIATHYNEPRLHKRPELPHEAPQAPEAAPAKKAFTSVKELPLEQKANYDRLSPLDRSKYLARRRAGQDHATALSAVQAKKAAPAKVATPEEKATKALRAPAKAAAPTAEEKATEALRPAPAKEQKPTVSAARVQAGDVVLAKKNDKGEWAYTRLKTGATPVTVTGKKGDAEGGHIITGHGPDGNEITLNPIRGQNVLTRHKEKTPRATKAVPAKAAENAVPAPTKATAAKVAKAAPAPKAVSEVQARADEANLPKTVTALRQAAREQKIRGFSTMNKEQLQRALLGEEVGTGGKLGPIAPDKISGHIEAAATDQAARNLMEDHTVADLKALAKHNDVNLKGITTKDRIKDAIIKHLRGEGPGALRPEKPTESLDEQLSHNRILKGGLDKEPDIKSIVDDVSGDDPDSLRSHRDELEKIAEETKTSDPIKSRIAQEAADAMGMRAQQISGVEEAPAAKKAVKAVKKAAAPKLSVHQERVRKQALADGASEEEARAAAEAAPVRAPAGTKAATAKAVAARKAAGLPTPREEGAPGPKLTAPKRAAKVTPPAKEGLPTGPERVQPQGVREAAAPGDLMTPEATRKLRAAGMEPGVTGKGRPDVAQMARESGIQGDAAGLVPAAQLDLNRGEKPSEVAKRLRRDADKLPKDAEEGLKSFPAKDKAEADSRISVAKENQAKLHDLADRIESHGPSKPTKRGIPPADEAKFKAAGVKPNKVVPEGSVKGERAQTPIDNQFRSADFDAAYMKHVDKRKRISDSAVESQDQIAGDISEGRITPEEGIRRIESEIAFNNDEIGNLSRDIRSGNLEGADLDRARSELNQLERDNASHENLSRDLHQHFGKERVTTPEVLDGIKKENPGFWEGLNKETDTEGFRQEIADGMREKGFDPGTLKGSNAQEIFQDALAKTIKQGLEQRAAKTTRKPRTQKLWTPGATPEPHPDFAPGGPKHLDAKAIAGDLDISDADLKNIQADLDSGMTPGQAAKEIGTVTRRRRDGNVYINGTWGHSKGEGVPGLPETSPERIAGDKAKYDEEVRKADQLDELANRLKAARRPIVRRTAATKATESIAEAKKATKEPAAKKALNQAEAAVKESGDEAQALKDRIIGRHREGWDKSTNAKEAQAAADAMRKDLTLGEIRQFFDGQGIKGRTKDDILKKAVERRFGSGGDISPEPVRTNPERARVNNRMEEAARLKQAGSGFANIDEMLANGGSERAMRHRVDTAGFSPEETAKIREAALAGDRPALDRIAQEHGLTRNTGAPGDIEPFEPGKHRAITGSHRKGEAVRVVQPGYQGTVEGRAFQAHPATVIAATPEEKQVMLTRLADEKNEAIKNLPAETRAAVLARVHRQGQNPVAKKAAARARAAKGIAEPEPLPTNKEVEVAQNMERLNAAKVKPFDAADIRAQLGKATTQDDARRVLRGLTIPELKQIDPEVGKLRGNKESLVSNLVTRHSDVARVGDMAKNLIEPLPIPTGKKGATVGELKSAAAPEALPQRGPIRQAHLHFDEGMSPAKLGREDGNQPLKAPNGSWQSDQGVIHMDSEIGQLWSDLAKDNRLPNSDLNKITAIGQDLGRGNITTKQAATELNGIRNGLTDGPVKDRFTEAVRGLDVKPSEYNVPDNTPKEVTDWLDHINAIPAFHNKTQGSTPFERAVALVRDIGEGKQGPGGDMKLSQVGHNVHESGDGVYQARKEGDKLFFPGSSKMTPEVRDWLRSWRNKEQAPEAPKAPAKATGLPSHEEAQSRARQAAAEPRKATKAAKKATPAKVTQAELRNPVPKAGAAAPSATPSQIQATGLKAGEGIPTSPMLSARNKLGSGNAGTLTKLDTAVRIPARHGDIPGLLRDLQEQLGRAGVGPNDEPRKTLVAWFQEHFKV